MITIDYTGRVIGKVTILHKVHDHVRIVRTGEEQRQPLMWRARCSCGHEWDVPHTRISLHTPNTCKHCAPSNRFSKLTLPKGKHYKKTHPSYNSWYSMWRRCTHPNYMNYKNYGGRGISVCDRWRDFDVFVDDMGIRPDGKTLDRIDNDKGYHPKNCRWATAKEQRANQRAPTPPKHKYK